MCCEEKLPSVSSINRIVRSNKRYDDDDDGVEEDGEDLDATNDENFMDNENENDQDEEGEEENQDTKLNPFQLALLSQQQQQQQQQSPTVGGLNLASLLNPKNSLKLMNQSNNSGASITLATASNSAVKPLKTKNSKLLPASSVSPLNPLMASYSSSSPSFATNNNNANNHFNHASSDIHNRSSHNHQEDAAAGSGQYYSENDVNFNCDTNSQTSNQSGSNNDRHQMGHHVNGIGKGQNMSKQQQRHKGKPKYSIFIYQKTINDRLRL